MAREVLSVGTEVLNGRYKVLKLIASKGMSAVYLVEDTSLNKRWCLKEIKKSKAGKGNVEYEALVQEANIMKDLDHVGIPRITTIEEEGDSLFIVMDYVDGMSLKQWLVQKGKISQDITLLWMRQITQTMIYLHNRREPIFYRDMKPDNVMIQTDGNLKLLDFGISMVLRDKNMVIDKALGTKGYAAPEQSKRGMKCDLRSDIYAMGKTMYYMLTGINPNQTNKEDLKPVREVDFTIDQEVESIVEKCCQENPNKRYQSCEELLYDLQNCKKLNKKRRRKMIRRVSLVGLLFAMGLPMLYGFYQLRMIGSEEAAWVLLGGGVLSVAASAICAVIFRVPSLLSELSGKKRKRQISKLKKMGTGGLDSIDMVSDSEIMTEGYHRVETPVKVPIDRRINDTPTGRLEKKKSKPVDNVEKSVDNSEVSEGTGLVDDIDADDGVSDIGVFASKRRVVKVIDEQGSIN